jgi:type I restriction enzyme M protein
MTCKDISQVPYIHNSLIHIDILSINTILNLCLKLIELTTNMAIKKSELYSSLSGSTDALSRGMNTSQYKDSMLVTVLLNYINTKWAVKPFAPITFPQRVSLADIVNYKGTTEIGDHVNKNILAPIAKANNLVEFPDFKDPTKLCSDKEMNDRLTKLIEVFENPALDFNMNNADGDDLLGDAFEHLMLHFAAQSRKNKMSKHAQKLKKSLCTSYTKAC